MPQIKKTAFIASGFQTNPDIRPEVDSSKIIDHRAALEDLNYRIGEQEDEAVVKDAYLPRIGGLLNNLDMLEAAATGDTAKYVQANVEAFDEPDERVLHATLGFFHAWVDASLNDGPSSIVREVARKAKEQLPEVPKVDNLWPAADEFAKVKSLYDSFYDEILAGLVLPDKFGREISFPAAAQALQNLGYDYEVVPQKEGVSTMAVDHGKKQVKIPPGELYTRERFTGLLGHEVRVHVEERIRGEQQPVRLLYSGLHKYLRGGEGKGVLAEQTVYSSMEEFLGTRRYFDIARRYLSLALARGTDGHGERDFREVFTIMNAIDLLWEAKEDPENLEAAMVKAVDKTWELLAMRTLRGWTGRGAAGLKDKVYLEGNLDQWGVLIGTPQIFPYLNNGKYDASNPEHLSILGRIGAIPQRVLDQMHA